MVDGGRVRLYGHLTTEAGKPLTQRRVRIYRRPVTSKKWTRVDVARSVAPTGWYQTYVHPDEGTLDRAVFRGGPHYQHTGSLRVRVRGAPHARQPSCGRAPPVG